MISAAMLAQLHCEIVFPDDFQSDAKRTVIFDPREDCRRFPRHRCRVDAVLKYQKTFPWLRRPDTFSRIAIRGVSRVGVGFLHSEQMFPKEIAKFAFPNGTERVLTVTRCRRLGPKCYHIGAEFDEPLNDLTEGNWH
jgi:hypothetical protein